MRPLRDGDAQPFIRVAFTPLLFLQYQGNPVVDHYLIDKFQASGQERLFGFVTAIFYDAAGNQDTSWGQNPGEIGSDRTNDTGNNICKHKIILTG